LCPIGEGGRGHSLKIKNLLPQRIESTTRGELFSVRLTSWKFLESGVLVPYVPNTLESSSGWQWSFKGYASGISNIILNVIINGQSFTLETKGAPQAPPPLVKKVGNLSIVEFGERNDFVLDTPIPLPATPATPATTATSVPRPFPAGNCGTAPASTSETPLPSKEMFYFRSQSYTFPFSVLENDTKTTLVLDGICGQTLPIYFIEFRQGFKVRARISIPIGQTQLTIAKDVVLPSGNYAVIVYSKAQTDSDRQQLQSFAFSKLRLESDKVLEAKKFLSFVISN